MKLPKLYRKVYVKCLTNEVDEGYFDEDEPEERALLGQLTDAPVHIDELRRSSGLPITSVSSTLTMLELKGKVKQVGCMHYIRIREAASVYDHS